MIDATRVTVLHDVEAHEGKYVLYWMQASQRATCNHALEHAVAHGNRLGLPVVVCFGLMDNYPEANERHYAFMLEGLRDVEGDLRRRRIRFVIRHGSPPEVAIALAGDAAMVVCDRGYLRHQKRWREQLADGVARRVEQVETDVIVPVEAASDREETAARTLRPKINRLRDQYLKTLRPGRVQHSSLDFRLQSDIDVCDVPAALSRLRIDRSVRPVDWLKGGSSAARSRLAQFIRKGLKNYAQGRREPAGQGTSLLAAHLHFGQISPLQIALAVTGARGVLAEDREAFLEELIVRRELAMNFVYYNPCYDTYEGLPRWAKRTLHEHRDDKRSHVYSRSELEAAQTHDPYWNAAQNEMVRSGYMHNSMRMYWGKKVLEWKNKPEEAYDDVLYLNNKHFLCGRDPSSYANVAWLFGLHDRPWGTRPVFGNVRYMNAAGLDRKFDMDAYLRKVEAAGSVLQTEKLSQKGSKVAKRR